jgi:hypothetical protein
VQGSRYDMPVVFGPSNTVGRGALGETRRITHTFRTEPAALEPLIPYHFSMAEDARVSVTGRMHMNVDWLAGRDYQVVDVSVAVQAPNDRGVTSGTYALVQWESDPRLVTVGREVHGIAKMAAEIPEHERDGDTAAFECYEYGTRLLRVDVSNLSPVDAPGALNPTTNDSMTVRFTWKYISGADGSPELDYPMVRATPTTIRSMWTGSSSLTFDQPTWEQCPFSSRIVETLAALPVVEVLPATVSVSSGVHDADASTKLAAPGTR